MTTAPRLRSSALCGRDDSFHLWRSEERSADPLCSLHRSQHGLRTSRQVAQRAFRGINGEKLGKVHRTGAVRANLAMARCGSSRLAAAKTLGQALANAPAHIGITTLSLHGLPAHRVCAQRSRRALMVAPISKPWSAATRCDFRALHSKVGDELESWNG
jgi:hypothetical protein